MNESEPELSEGTTLKTKVANASPHIEGTNSRFIQVQDQEHQA